MTTARAAPTGEITLPTQFTRLSTVSFGLGRSLTLYGLARLWRLPKVLGVGHQGRKLEQTNHQEIDEDKTAVWLFSKSDNLICSSFACAR